MSLHLNILSVLICIGVTLDDTSNTGAILTFTSINDGSLYNKKWNVAPSLFGFKSYKKDSVQGWLVLPKDNTYHQECVSGSQESLHENEYIYWLRTGIDPHKHYGFIMLIDRGDCYFTEKVKLAETLGAIACIVVDHTPENLFNMWVPDNWNDDINIPSVLLGQRDGEILYQHLGV